MTIAELFISLGIKGSDKSKTDLDSISKGLGSVKSMSFEAKAAIAALFYGLEEMMKGSAQRGQGLINFSSLTGLDDVELQRWEKASERAGNSIGSIESTVKGLQKTMSQLTLNEGMPKYFDTFADSFEHFDRVRASKDPMYLMGKMRDFAKATKGMGREGVGNEILYGVGADAGFVSAARQGKFDQSKLSAMPSLSHGENKQLANVNESFIAMWQKIQKEMDKFVAAHGEKLVNDLAQLADALINFSKVVFNILEKMDAFGMITSTVKAVTHPKETASGIWEGLRQGALSNRQMFRGDAGIMSSGSMDSAAAMFKKMQNEKSLIEKALPAGSYENMSTGNTVNINTTLNGIEEVDYQKLNNGNQDAVNRALKSFPQGQRK